jgi:hypothetical protein
MGALLLASLSFLGASFPLLITLMTPLDSLTARGRVYRLANIMALADDNYALFECERYGLVCRQIYRSGDYSLANPGHVGLAYDVATNTLSVAIGERGTIHTYEPPGAQEGRDRPRRVASDHHGPTSFSLGPTSLHTGPDSWRRPIRYHITTSSPSMDAPFR